jgi:cytochrome c oxidase assembly factor CtaG
MVQHLLIGDLGALFVVIGVTGPLLRPLLAVPIIGRLRGLGHPVVALALWTINLYAWHVPALYDLALRNDEVHALEHAGYLLFGCVMWAALFEPLPGPAWFGTGPKVIYVIVMRLIEALLANILMWSHTVFYPYYLHVQPLWGITPRESQSLGGVAMLLEGGTTSIVLICWFLYRFLSDGEIREELVALGVPRNRAERAVRYGRGQELTRRLRAPGYASPPILRAPP